VRLWRKAVSGPKRSPCPLRIPHLGPTNRRLVTRASTLSVFSSHPAFVLPVSDNWLFFLKVHLRYHLGGNPTHRRWRGQTFQWGQSGYCGLKASKEKPSVWGSRIFGLSCNFVNVHAGSAWSEGLWLLRFYSIYLLKRRYCTYTQEADSLDTKHLWRRLFKNKYINFCKTNRWTWQA